MVDVLYVEYNVNDVDIFARLMQKLDRPITYAVLKNGTEALAYLTEQAEQRTALPKLVLLDMNLGGLSGLDILHKTRTTDWTKYLPIVAFSTSDSPKDIQMAYEAAINAYVVKPGSYKATGTVLAKLCDFWVENNTRTDSNE